KWPACFALLVGFQMQLTAGRTVAAAAGVAGTAMNAPANSVHAMAVARRMFMPTASSRRRYLHISRCVRCDRRWPGSGGEGLAEGQVEEERRGDPLVRAIRGATEGGHQVVDLLRGRDTGLDGPLARGRDGARVQLEARCRVVGQELAGHPGHLEARL